MVAVPVGQAARFWRAVEGRLASFGGGTGTEKRRRERAECQHVATKTALRQRDSVQWGHGKGEGRRWTALFYDGTVATRCGELTTDDARGRFRMSIRLKNGTFYDANLANNNYVAQANHTLRFAERNLVAEAQKMVWREFPEHNPGKVVEALMERCDEAVTHKRSIGESQSEAQNIRHSRGISV